MKFSKGTIRSSPYVGVFASVTDDVALVPHSVQQKEAKMLEEHLGVEVIRANIGNSGLIGVLSKGIGRKFAVSGIIEKEEEKALHSAGLETLKMKGSLTSTGNLICLNSNGGVASELVLADEVARLSEFFKVKFEHKNIAGNELCGASITVTNKGFICHPDISEDEFSSLETLFKVKGIPTTANFGDLFIGNSVIANSSGVIAGVNTSGIELSKIDEGLRGD